MRITLRNQYSNFLSNLMGTQNKLMDLNIQASSQKQINKPSDDPVGSARVLNYRSSIATIEQYQNNVDTAKGWLNLADESMLQVSTILSELTSLAEQGATGTMAAKDRQATAYQARQLFSQLVSLANTRYEGNSIFGGHELEDEAYTEGLMVYDQDGNNLGRATGSSEHSILVQFVGDETDPAVILGEQSNPVACRYSDDGGVSWTETSIAANSGKLDAGGVSIDLTGYEVSFSPESNTKTSTGTWLTIAPTAIYHGDHEDQSAVTYDSVLTASPTTAFSQATEIRITSYNSSTTTITGCEYWDSGSEAWVAGTISGTTLTTPYGDIDLDLTGVSSEYDLTGFSVAVNAGAAPQVSLSTESITATPLSGITQDAEIRVTSGSLGGTITYQYREAGGTWVPATPVSLDTSTGNTNLETPYGAVRLVGPDGQSAVGLTMSFGPGSTDVLNLGTEVNSVAQGSFSSDVMVRIDNDPSVELGDGTTIEYSYSTDGGVNWSSGHTASNDDTTAELVVPGGKLVLSPRTGETTLAADAQFVIHPQTASLNVEISEGQFVTLNNIGSEIFGGYYEYGSQPVFSDSDVDRNIFVAVGKLVAALENNDQEGCSAALDSLGTSQEYFTTQLASVGARENRLDVAETVLSGLQLNETERMSNVEDVDLATLLTELANQQLTYETVLKSSSMIMKMSLVNYL